MVPLLKRSSFIAIPERAIIYERAVKALPGSYKLWHAYLRERLELVRNLPVTHSQYETLNNTFERALITMHKMPRIWIMYLQVLTHQKLITRTRRSFDRALCALPVAQHGRIWELYLAFVGQRGFPIETALRVCRRYMKYDPSHIEDFIEFLVNSRLWQEAAEMLASVLKDDSFSSIKGKTNHRLWLELCDLLTIHTTEVSGLNVDVIIRGGIKKFTDDVGGLWTSLADYYIRRNLTEKAREIFEEGITTVVTVRDFSVIFDAYTQFEESLLAIKMETQVDEEDEEENGDEDELDIPLDVNISVANLEKILNRFWINDLNDVELRLACLELLMDRRPELANSVLLRQNPHNVKQWHRRVKLFEGNPTRQILTYTQAVQTIDPMKALGKPHTLWVAFAKLFESYNDISNARLIFDKAVQVNYKAVDDLASLWCEWAGMELRHKNFKGALKLMRRATAVPTAEVKRRVAANGNEPVQMKLHKSLRLWTFYVDLEESLGTLESTSEVYEKILDLRIATAQTIINYAMLLEEHKYFEDAFKVYERGVKIFKYPHVKDIWMTYLSKFVKRYGESKLERARELYGHAVEMAPAESVQPLYLQYAKLEEDFGLAKRAMEIYDQATKVVPSNEKLSMFEIYITRAAEIFGVPKTREIYEQAIQAGLPGKDVKTMCLKYAEFEKSLGEIDRARGIYTYASQFACRRSDADFWTKWNDFEVLHGNKGTFREMFRIKKTVSGSYDQTHFIPPELLMSKDQMLSNDKAKDKLRQAGVPEEEMAALGRKITISATNNAAPADAIAIQQKDVPSDVFGGLARKCEDNEKYGNEDDSPLGALGRMKRRKQMPN